jgi:hypothetical protein
VRWPRLKRRRKGDAKRVAGSSGFTPGAWAQAALPAPANGDTDPSLRPTGNLAVVSATPLDDSRNRDTPPTGVRLGFSDGSALDLDPDDPHSAALRAVADVLAHRGPLRQDRPEAANQRNGTAG